MKKPSRFLASLLMIAVFLSPEYALAAEGLFRLPPFITQIESEAFSGVDLSNGIFIPDSCTSIAPDAFSNPEALDIYGFSGSFAETYALEKNASFHSVDIKNASVSGPLWASPDRSVSFTADFECAHEAMVHFEIEKNGTIVFKSEPSKEKTLFHRFTDGGEYTVSAVIESPFETAVCPMDAPIIIAERIKTINDIFYLAVGESVNLISSDETRTVTLSTDSEGLTVSGTSVTAKSLGKYTVTLKAETEKGTVYTDVPVEVIVPTSSVSIESERTYVLENQTLQMTAVVYPENATYKNVTWSVDDDQIAEINESGLLTGKKRGTVVVFATSSDVMSAREIRVEIPVASFEIAPAEMPDAFLSGMRFTLSAAATPENADNPTCSYVSLTPDIVSVDAFTGVVTCLKEGEARILATANDLGGASGEYAFTVLPGITDISFASVPGVMKAGEDFQLEISVLPENAQNKTLTFTSSDESVVSVSDSGLITAIKPGSAAVTVSTVNGFSKNVPITVQTPVSSITGMLDDLYLNPGMTADPIGNFVFVKPSNATNPALTWSSNNAFVASVDKNTGLITAQSNGTCQITGISHNGKSISFTVHVVSDKPVIKKLSINHTYGALNVGNTATITPKADVSNKYTSGTWYSDHPEILDIVFIDSSDTVTVKALSAGTCTLYAISSSGISASCTIVVNPIVVKSMTINATSITLNVSDSFPLGVIFYPGNATATHLTWTSSNASVASCDELGLVRALSGGSAVITAETEDGVSASCRVTVNTVPMTQAKMDEEEITVLAGESGYPAYTVEPRDATPASFIWNSSAPDVVSVSYMTGEMTYLQAGSAVISASALDGSGLNISMTVHVQEVPVTSLTANAEKIELLPGESFDLATRVLPIGASYAKPNFTSKDSKIASVSEDGRVTAVSNGTTEITVTAGRDDYVHTLTIPVTVKKLGNTTYRALIMGQFTVPASDGYLPFSNNSTKGFTDAVSRSSIDGNRYEVTRIPGSPTPGAIRNALSRLANQADEDDVTVIFFLTHGSNEGKEGYVMQTNSGVVIESIDMINALKEISGNVVFVLCTCNSGRILSTSGAKALKNSLGAYEGKNGKGRLSFLCSSTTTISSYYRINDEKASYDFYTYAVTRGLGWDMLADHSTGSLPADANGDNKITVKELASYSRGAT